MPRKKRVLVADDEARYRDDLRAFLESEGFTVDIGTNYMDTREHLDKNVYELIVCDKGMPIGVERRIHQKCGLELLAHAKWGPRHKDTPFILHAADDSRDLPELVKRLGGIYHLKNSSPYIGAVMLKLLGRDK